MKLLIISDTHISDRTKALPEHILALGESVDAIVHAGDFTSEDTFGLLKALGPPLYAVRGNMDDSGLARVLDDKLVFELQGLRIGLTHGSGAPWGLADRVRKAFPDDIDVIVFGHSHLPFLEETDGLLLFNPGSAAEGSYGMLYLEGGMASGEIRHLEK
ncbi:MAG: metallophosphoesterase [candidate division WOR-3 bacterium]